MSCAEEPQQNQSHSKSGEIDGNGLVMCCAFHQQHYYEFPSGGPLVAVEREAD